MIIIDGSEGEGGGQVLRTALSLSLVTGKPFRIEKIRANRSRPGVMRQHVTAVEAACAIGDGECEALAVGASELGFTPGKVKPGEHRFAVGTAGSTSLVLQTILPPLMLADAPSSLVLEGGTHNIFAPPFDFRPIHLGKKIAAGAQFCQTQFVFDVPAFARFMAEVVDRGLAQRCAVLAGVGPIRSLRALEFIRTSVPGIHVPDDFVRRLRGVPADRVAEEGVTICVETIQQLRQIPGVAGVHVMAFGFERGVPEILERGGVRRDPIVETTRAG